MNIPGFVAEKAIYRSRGRYRTSDFVSCIRRYEWRSGHFSCGTRSGR